GTRFRSLKLRRPSGSPSQASPASGPGWFPSKHNQNGWYLLVSRLPDKRWRRNLRSPQAAWPIAATQRRPARGRSQPGFREAPTPPRPRESLAEVRPPPWGYNGRPPPPNAGRGHPVNSGLTRSCPQYPHLHLLQEVAQLVLLSRQIMEVRAVRR